MGDALPSFEEYSSSPLMRVNLPKPLDGRGSILVSQTPRSLDFEALRQAVEKRDAYTLLGLYAVDAQVHAVNRNIPSQFSAGAQGQRADLRVSASGMLEGDEPPGKGKGDFREGY
jgi:hypothetical protein